jgi:hypothetical protein
VVFRMYGPRIDGSSNAERPQTGGDPGVPVGGATGAPGSEQPGEHRNPAAMLAAARKSMEGWTAPPRPARPARRPRLSPLEEALDSPDSFILLPTADVVYATDASTGRRFAVFYGRPADVGVRPNLLRPWVDPAWVEFPVDRDKDDPRRLAKKVRYHKGSCLFAEDLWRMLRDPFIVGALEFADLIFAVDKQTGERCDLFYGDPATEPKANRLHHPCRYSPVVSIKVNLLSDDRDLLAQAVRRAKGSCCYQGPAWSGGS